MRAQPQEARGVGVLEWVPLDAPGAPPAVPPEPPTRPQGRGCSASPLQVALLPGRGMALEGQWSAADQEGQTQKGRAYGREVGNLGTTALIHCGPLDKATLLASRSVCWMNT